MADESTLTCYCGLYCLDCIPSQKELYATAAKLEHMLADLQFEKYAEFKANQAHWSKTNEAFKFYPRFIEVLNAIRDLECPATCREGGGYKGGACQVRKCAISKNLTGCWECDDYRACELLQQLTQFHPNLLHHLDLIKTKGVENWARHRMSHYYWQ